MSSRPTSRAIGSKRRSKPTSRSPAVFASQSGARRARRALRPPHKNDALISTASLAALGISGEGVGFLLLLVATWHTGLITAFLEALPLCQAAPCLRRLRQPTLLGLLLTLLFLFAVELRRTWDLRTYTGDALAFLTGPLPLYS